VCWRSWGSQRCCFPWAGRPSILVSVYAGEAQWLTGCSTRTHKCVRRFAAPVSCAPVNSDVRQHENRSLRSSCSGVCCRSLVATCGHLRPDTSVSRRVGVCPLGGAAHFHCSPHSPRSPCVRLPAHAPDLPSLSHCGYSRRRSWSAVVLSHNSFGSRRQLGPRPCWVWRSVRSYLLAGGSLAKRGGVACSLTRRSRRTHKRVRAPAGALLFLCAAHLYVRAHDQHPRSRCDLCCLAVVAWRVLVWTA
jgi:hypothetical protein